MVKANEEPDALKDGHTQNKAHTETAQAQFEPLKKRSKKDREKEEIEKERKKIEEKEKEKKEKEEKEKEEKERREKDDEACLKQLKEELNFFKATRSDKPGDFLLHSRAAEGSSGEHGADAESQTADDAIEEESADEVTEEETENLKKEPTAKKGKDRGKKAKIKDEK